MHENANSTPNPWRIAVRGHPPRANSGVNSGDWRKAIQRAVMVAYPQAPFTSPHLEIARFTMEVTFRMTSSDFARRAVDLDNFAKPVIDTLFTSQNTSRLSRVLLPNVDDTQVFRLFLEKIEVPNPQDQGADITISWDPSVSPPLSTSYA